MNVEKKWTAHIRQRMKNREKETQRVQKTDREREKTGK